MKKELEQQLLELDETLEIDVKKVKYITFEMEDGTKKTITKLSFVEMLKNLEENKENFERLSDEEQESEDDFLDYYQDEEIRSLKDLQNAMKTLFGIL
ncbi:hypothetical protein [Fusobacterium necrophorum]|uniref:Uncharacterized protein n=1 Tax=Fusobacterium necrophorum subsp. funduliforme TaxID=143387 RepID=A0A162J5J6_9FUSO|nr:hypothetical protein [Fusobacterium necrophorum]AVQ21345.1 hypothetical protein C4N15_06705 [Fusobacterium necrophorum subsp. funduliforme]KYL05177.1 hypothetical protein A2J07_00145 [Fusobacterium necrophorum subsp. funduliforme]MDK4525023.1 hypothetical protein [Fusobacterium necrophorum]